MNINNKETKDGWPSAGGCERIDIQDVQQIQTDLIIQHEDNAEDRHDEAESAAESRHDKAESAADRRGRTGSLVIIAAVVICAVTSLFVQHQYWKLQSGEIYRANQANKDREEKKSKQWKEHHLSVENGLRDQIDSLVIELEQVDAALAKAEAAREKAESKLEKSETHSHAMSAYVNSLVFKIFLKEEEMNRATPVTSNGKKIKFPILPPNDAGF